MADNKILLIDELLNNHGAAILSEATAADLDLALACAVVEKESNGRNIFGCDKFKGQPHFLCHLDVTEDRVRQLRDGGNYTWGMNGVGLTQLTYWSFVEEAERIGGAHLPWTQCRVGFRLLNSYLDDHPYEKALAAYNAGEDNWEAGRAYAADLAIKHSAWDERFAELEAEESESGLIVVDGFSARPLVPTSSGYLYDKISNEWVVIPDHADAKVEVEGVWPRIILPESTQPSRWEWWDYDTYYRPYAQGTGSYQDAHPTRYDDVWRYDVEEVARFMVDEFGVWCNTYYGHPPPELVGGTWYDSVSIDIWGEYRGSTGNLDAVDEAFWWFFNNAEPPWIRWCIRNGEIWDDYNGWRTYWDYDVWSDGPHRYHGHLTLH